MEGEIAVMEVVEEAYRERLRMAEWVARKRRDGAWIALKEWWGAKGKKDKQRVVELYGDDLVYGWVLWANRKEATKGY